METAFIFAEQEMCQKSKNNHITLTKFFSSFNFLRVVLKLPPKLKLVTRLKFWSPNDIIMRDTGVLQIMNGFAQSSEKELI